jgi:hypothetical protein
MLTNGDLDTGLVEFDSGGPGDEAGTEKQDLVRGHDCSDVMCCLSVYLSWMGKSEATIKVKTSLTYQDPSTPFQWLIKLHTCMHAARQTTPLASSQRRDRPPPIEGPPRAATRRSGSKLFSPSF